MTATESNDYTKPSFLWGIILGGIIPCWIYLAPVPYNRAYVARLSEMEPLAAAISMAPNLEIADEKSILYQSGVASLIYGFVILFPTLVKKETTVWSLASSILVAVVSSGLALFYMPSKRYTLDLLGLVSVGLSLACVLGVKGVARLGSPLFKGPSDGRRAMFLPLMLLALLVSFFVSIPAACGRWSAGGLEHLYGDSAPLIYLLYMKDKESPVHAEFVDVLVPGRDYFLVRLSEQVPHSKPGQDSVAPLDLVDPPPLIDKGVSMPILIRRDSIEAIAPVPSPTVMLAAWKKSLKDFVWKDRVKYTVERSDDGFYSFVVQVPTKGITSSQPAK
jgi:hypothetical protein